MTAPYWASTSPPSSEPPSAGPSSNLPSSASLAPPAPTRPRLPLRTSRNSSRLTCSPCKNTTLSHWGPARLSATLRIPRHARPPRPTPQVAQHTSDSITFPQESYHDPVPLLPRAPRQLQRHRLRLRPHLDPKCRHIAALSLHPIRPIGSAATHCAYPLSNRPSAITCCPPVADLCKRDNLDSCAPIPGTEPRRMSSL